MRCVVRVAFHILTDRRSAHHVGINDVRARQSLLSCCATTVADAAGAIVPIARTEANGLEAEAQPRPASDRTATVVQRTDRDWTMPNMCVFPCESVERHSWNSAYILRFCGFWPRLLLRCFYSCLISVCLLLEYLQMFREPHSAQHAARRKTRSSHTDCVKTRTPQCRPRAQRAKFCRSLRSLFAAEDCVVLWLMTRQREDRPLCEMLHHTTTRFVNMRTPIARRQRTCN